MIDNLKCADFENRIHQQLDARQMLADDPVLNDHARQCSTCRLLLKDYSAIESGIFCAPFGNANRKFKPARAEAPSPTCLKSTHWSIGKDFSRFVQLSTVAAALLVAIGLFSLNQSQPINDGNSPIPNSTLAMASQNGAATTIAHTAQIPLHQRAGSMSVIRPDSTSNLDFFYPISLSQIAVSNQQRVSWAPFPSPPPWRLISQGFDPLNPFLQYSVELPGVRPLKCSVDLTIDMLHRSFAKPVKAKFDASQNLRGIAINMHDAIV